MRLTILSAVIVAISLAAQALADQPSTAPASAVTSGFVEGFFHNLHPHEPMYFLAGSRPTAKFQLSLRYQIFDEGGSLTGLAPAIKGLNFAYSQTSFWDLAGDSKPFKDNSYRPEGLFAYDNILPEGWHPANASRIGLQAGFQHESNGLARTDSRSLNVVYLRPIITWECQRPDGLFLTLAPRIYTYVSDLSENPDIKDYRGFGDLRVIAGWRDGLQIAAVGRLGTDGNKGSLELDVSESLRQLTRKNIDLYLYAQLFTGFGETLIDYNHSTTSFRVGVALVR